MMLWFENFASEKAMGLAELLLSHTTVVLCAFLALFCLVRWRMVPTDRKRTELLMVAATLAVPFENIAWWIDVGLSHLRSSRYDLYAYRIDNFLGAPSFPLGQMLLRHPHVLRILLMAYDGLPLAMIVAFAPYLWLKPPREAARVIVTFAVNLVAAVPFYLLIPVAGPAFIFPDFPNVPSRVVPHVVYSTTIPNGIPSVHFSTALLVWAFLSEWSLGRFAGMVFAVLTIGATLGTGQHYLIDLFCALPYAYAVYRVAALLASRIEPASSVRFENIEVVA